MNTIAGTGHSTKTDTIDAAREAATAASAALRGRPPLCGFVFAGPAHRLDVAIKTIADSAGVAPARLLGSSTAGELSQRGLTHGGLCLLLLASDCLDVDTAFVDRLGPQQGQAAIPLCARFAELAQAAAGRGYAHSTTVVMLNALSGAGEALAQSIVQRTRPFQQVVGGAAGDEGAFQATPVALGERTGHDAAVAAHFFGARRFGVGVGHGLRPTAGHMVATRCQDNLLFELDGQPAFAVYQRYARSLDVDLQPASAGKFLINHELGVYALGELRMARAPLSVRPDGALVLAAAVPQGATVCFLDGDPNAMIQAAHGAARTARAVLGERSAAAVLLFDCICRGTILGAQFQREIDAVRQVFPEAPLLGFLTYGEIARAKGQIDPWHNAAAVVVAIPA